MPVVNKNGFKIACSGVATQIVIYSHGGYRTATDGFTEVPDGLRLCFYTKHGDVSSGIGVYDAVVKFPNEARGGLLKECQMPSDADIADIAKMNNTDVEHVRGGMYAGLKGVYDSFGAGVKMFDYGLSKSPPGRRLNGENSTFAEHVAGTHVDVDLMMVKSDNRVKLSDALKLIEKSGNYQTVHFGACRVTR